MSVVDVSTSGSAPGDREDLAWLYGPAPTRSPTDLPPRLSGPDRPDTLRGWPSPTPGGGLVRVPPTLLLGASGGAGVTTTAYGVASAAAEEHCPEVAPVIVDATPAGGSDLASRTADHRPPSATVQSWLASDHPGVGLPSAVDAVCGLSSSGARVLARDDRPLPRRESLVSVHRIVCNAGFTPVYDGGSPVGSPAVHPLRADGRNSVGIVVAGRPDAANRLRPVLSWLDDHYGDYLLANTVIVVAQQTPFGGGAVVNHLRAHLGRWVRSVVEIPCDPHLAIGEAIRWDILAEATKEAYRLLLKELSS